MLHRDRQKNKLTDLTDVLENAKLYGQASRAVKTVARQDTPMKNYRSIQLLEEADGAGDDYDQFLNAEMESDITALLPTVSTTDSHEISTVETIPRNALYTRHVAPELVGREEFTLKGILTRPGWMNPTLGERKAQRRIRDPNSWNALFAGHATWWESI